MAKAVLVPVVAALLLFLGVPWISPAEGLGNPAADLDQCANGAVGAPDEVCTGANWLNGNLNASKAHYVEGDSVPYRMRLSELTVGATHTVTFEWDTTKGGVHALDYLTTYNRTETDAEALSGVAGLDPAVFSTYPIPADTTMQARPDWSGTQVAGVLTMWGATITAVSPYTYTGSWAGDSSTSITVTFTATVANPVLAWGGHIASRANWGAGGSAVSIPGSPFHMRLLDLDGSGGNQDRSLSNDAVIFPASITIVKNAIPDATTVFPFTASPAPLTSFSLVDDGDPAAPAATRTFAGIMTFGTYTVTETTVAGWTLTGLACVDPSDGSTTSLGTRTATIDLDEGEDITCTFTNTRNPSITLVKDASPTSLPEPGGNVTFTLTVTNDSAVTAVTIDSLTDTVYGNLDGKGTCDVPQTIAASGSYSCLFTGVVSGNAGSSHRNVATASGTSAIGTPVSASDDATVTITDQLPDITVTKTANPTSVPETGGNVDFTYTVTNGGTEPVTITALSDDRFGTLTGDADCHVGTVLAGGASCTFTATFAVPAGDFPGSHVDIFSATASDGDGNSDTATDDATVTYTDVLPDITVTKTANPLSVPETGGNVVFSYVVTNHSLEAATITALGDNRFGPLTGDADCHVGTVLAAGASCSFEATFAVPGDAPNSHVNVFTAAVSDGDGNSDTATDDATVVFTDVLPDISVTKTASPTSVPETGGNVTFTYVVTNNSSEAATITVLSDSVFGALAGDGDCQVGTVIAPHSSCTFTAVHFIAGDFGVDHHNVFTATVTDDDGNTDTATDPADVTLTDVLPDISVTKTANPTSVPETGGDVLFTYVVTNNSLEAATITVLTDDRFGVLAGDGDCHVGTVLAGGASCTFTATFAVPAGDFPGSHVDVFTAVVSDGDGNNDTATDDATVTYTDVLPDITVTKTADPTSVPETGGDVTFTYTVTNHSLEAATITSLTDDRFGELTGDADCKVGTVLAGGASCSFSVTKRIAGTAAGAPHHNVATVVVTDDDGNTDTATDDATVGFIDVKPQLDIVKVPSATTVESGQAVTYTYTVKNPGAEPVLSVTVTDDKCSPVTFVAGDADGDGALDSSETWTFRCTTTLTGTTTNVGTVTGTDDEGNKVTDTDTATVLVLNPRIAIDKSASTDSARVGGSVTYTYVVTNPGDAPLTDVVVGDDKCAPLAYGSGDADGDAALDPGEAWTFTCTATMPEMDGPLTNIGTVSATDALGATVSATDTATVTVAPVEVLGVVLARTGAAVLRAVALGLALIGLGTVLVVATRRRFAIR